MSTYEIEGYQPSDGKNVSLNQNEVSPGFFSLLGIPLISGREFREGDVQGAAPVAIINESLARKFFEGRNPLGQHLRHVRGGNFEIVGLVKDAKYDDLREKPKPFAYFSAAQDQLPGPMTFYVRSEIAPASLPAAIRQTVRSFDANLPVDGPRTFHGQIMASVFADRMLAALSGTFALLATLLASVGLYGVIAWAVTQRRRELGIRMALGARPRDVMTMVLREVLWLGIAGIAVAAPLWMAGAHFLSAQLFDVKPGDALSLTAAVAILTLVALAAGWIPAFRASRIDPISAIRYE
jgi:predicted permease